MKVIIVGCLICIVIFFFFPVRSSSAQECPHNYIKVGGDASDDFCKCARPGYEKRGDACVQTTVNQPQALKPPPPPAVRRPALCISNAGHGLVNAIRDCKVGHNEPSIFACLKGTGVTEHSIGCLAALPSTVAAAAATLAACGIVVAKVPLDALIRCKDISNQCIVDALQAHKQEVADCRR